jgi:hypothetical protein
MIDGMVPAAEANKLPLPAVPSPTIIDTLVKPPSPSKVNVYILIFLCIYVYVYEYM